MGDRANVVIKGYGDSRVYLYTHWGGYNLPAVVHRALSRKQRWDDAPYLARIIFCEMVKNDIDGETGYGISSHIEDNEYDLIVIDTEAGTIGLAHESEQPDTYTSGSIASFVDKDIADKKGWQALGHQDE